MPKLFLKKVWSAATASSAVPGIFEAQTLLVKHLDGSIHAESRGGYHSDGCGA